MKRLLFISLIAIGCSNQFAVHTDRDPEINLQNFTTYQWSNRASLESDRNPLYYNELNDKRIKSSVDNILMTRGLIPATENPDVLIHYHILVEDKVSIDLQPYGFTYGRYWANAQRAAYTYKEGTLIIDLMEAKTGSLAWRGWAVGVIDQNNSKNSLSDMIGKAVAEIFAKYPVIKYPESKHHVSKH
jgi:hypothetical protein